MNAKKLSALVLSASMAAALAGCGSSSEAAAAATSAAATGEASAAATESADAVYMSDTAVSDIKLQDTENLTEATTYQIQTLDYVVTALEEDHEYNANFVDGLLENDKYGNLAPCLATSYDVSDDGLTYTFHLRDGVKWVTDSGEEYDTVKADDFVAGLRHAAEFESSTSWLLQGVIEGYDEYVTGGDFSDEAWDKVGVKAVDDLTVQYTVTAPTPYFPSMTTYAILYPVNREFLESQGDGCALGAPDKTACSYGTTDPTSILYNGGYLLLSQDDKSSTVLVKNDAYWDADNVFLKKITRIYDDGSDPYSQIRSFEQGVYAAAPLSAQWENFDDYMAKYDGYTSQSLPNSATFGIVFNYNRQIFDNTNYATDTAEAERTHEALLNENFRKAIRSAWNREAYLMVSAPKVLADSMMKNINNPSTIVRKSDGTAYVDLVTKAYDEATGTDVDLSDGQDPWYDPAKAKEYLEAAKADGLDISADKPIHLDMLVTETSKRLVDQAQSLKDSIESATDGQIIIELVMRDEDTVKNIAYYNQDPAGADYDISTFTGWSPDYADPKSCVDIYSTTTGYYMTSMGLTTQNDETFGSDDDIKEAVGLAEYEELYRAADAITDDLDARYEAFAKADAELVDKCFFIPGQMQSRTVRVTHVVPFSRVYSTTGMTEYKYKGMKLQEDLVTTADYDAAYEDFQAGGTPAKLTNN